MVASTWLGRRWREQGEVGEPEMPPKRNTPEPKELGRKGEVAFGVETEEFGSNIFAFGGRDHFGDGIGGVGGQDGKAAEGGNTLNDGERLEPSRVGPGAVEIYHVKGAQAILSNERG